jgi:histidinol dehydrogenase
MRILDCRTDLSAVGTITARRWEDSRDVQLRAAEILAAVRVEGDPALLRYTREYDCPAIDTIRLQVSREEVEAAYRTIDKRFLRALRIARKRITAFHRRQVPRSFTVREAGSRIEQRFQPLRRVGIYVPGGKASYPSTVLMNAIPASIAGVKEIVMVTPCDRNGKIRAEVLVAAAECRVSEIYRVGGAQAIAALAFGTETIRKVDKVTGPGNAYVAAAKQQLYGRVGIDMIAGPTEVVVVADESARPDYIAADLIAQAEHDENASPMVVTTSPRLAESIAADVEQQLNESPRAAIARKAFDGQGIILLVANLSAAAGIVNELAPEHLEVLVKNPDPFVGKIRCAGSIFIGHWSTEAFGDYLAGPNHTLPTLGTARFSSALGVYDFMRFTNIVSLGKKQFTSLAKHVEVLAEAEGLAGHAASVRIRRERP